MQKQNESSHKNFPTQLNHSGSRRRQWRIWSIWRPNNRVAVWPALSRSEWEQLEWDAWTAQIMKGDKL